MGCSSLVTSSHLSSCASRKSVLKRDNENFGREVKGEREIGQGETLRFACSGVAGEKPPTSMWWG